jgi:hypothetical protein
MSVMQIVLRELEKVREVGGAVLARLEALQQQVEAPQPPAALVSSAGQCGT